MRSKSSLILSVWVASACGTTGGGGDGTEGGTEPAGTDSSTGTDPSSSSAGTTTDVDSSGASSGSSDGGSESESGCPPVDPPIVPSCATCTMNDDCAFDCDFGDCNTDCTRDACGTECITCVDPRACAEDWSAGVCDGDGACVEEATCEGGLQEGFEKALTVQAGCSDMIVYARSNDDALGLSLYLDNLDVNGVTEPTEFTDIPFDAAQWLEIRVGTAVTSAECTDVITKPGPQVDALWIPTAGTIDVAITPGAGGPLADVTLTDFVFEHDGESVALASYTFEDILVGWFPG